MSAAMPNYSSDLPEGYTQRDSGTGVNEILDPNGNVVGQTYDNVRDAAQQYAQKNFLDGLKSGLVQYNGQWVDPTSFKEYGTLSEDNKWKAIGDAGYYLRENSGYSASDRPWEVWENLYGKEALSDPAVLKNFDARTSAQMVDVANYGLIDGSSLAPDQLLNEEHLGQQARLMTEDFMANVFDPRSPQFQQELLGGFQSGHFAQFDPNKALRYWDEVNLPESSNRFQDLGDIRAGYGGYQEAMGGNQIFEMNEDNPYYRGTGNAEKISGENALVGSTPVFDDSGNLIGYDVPLIDPWSDSHKGKNWSWQAGVSRNYLDPEWWKTNTVGTGDKSRFIPVDKASEIPGWENRDYYGQLDVKKGIVQNIWENTSPTHLLLNQKFEDMQPIGEAVGNAFIPGLGSVINAVDGYSKGDAEAGTKGLGRAVLSYVTPGLADSINSTGVGSVLGTTGSKVAAGAITGASGAAISGGDLSAIGQAALLGGASAGGGAILNSTLPSYLSALGVPNEMVSTTSKAVSTGLVNAAKGFARGDDAGQALMGGILSGGSGAIGAALNAELSAAGVPAEMVSPISQMVMGGLNQYVRSALAKR